MGFLRMVVVKLEKFGCVVGWIGWNVIWLVVW